MLRSYDEQDVHDALDAIVRNNATEEAYVAAESAGWKELFPGVVYQVKGENQMEVATAKAIITQAKKDETYPGPIPEGDDECVKEAEGLVEMAKQAWDQYIRGPEVEAILKLAENGNAASEPEQVEPQAETPQSEEEEVAPEQDLSGIDESLAKVEPWEGYNDDRVKEITEGINISLESDSPEDFQTLLAHIHAYESTHKRRSRILSHVKQAWERVGGTSEESEQTQQARVESPDETNATEQEADVASPGDEQDLSVDESVSQAPESEAEEVDAASESRAEVAQSREEDRSAQHEAEPSSQNRAYAALVEGVDRELQRERLDIPKPPVESAPELPWTWADISDGDLRDLHMQFASLAYYKSYQLSREERIARHCREAADELTNRFLVAADKYDDKGKQKTVTILEAEISLDPNVKKWRQLQYKHEAFTQNARRELESYNKLVEALSRLESMRHQAWERARR